MSQKRAESEKRYIDTHDEDEKPKRRKLPAIPVKPNRRKLPTEPTKTIDKLDPPRPSRSDTDATIMRMTIPEKHRHDRLTKLAKLNGKALHIHPTEIKWGVGILNPDVKVTVTNIYEEALSVTFVIPEGVQVLTKNGPIAKPFHHQIHLAPNECAKITVHPLTVFTDDSKMCIEIRPELFHVNIKRRLERLWNSTAKLVTERCVIEIQ